jgi:hypothetical protein
MHQSKGWAGRNLRPTCTLDLDSDKSQLFDYRNSKCALHNIAYMQACAIHCIIYYTCCNTGFQGLIQDFFVEGGNSCARHCIQTRGVWGHAPPEILKFYNLWDCFWWLLRPHTQMKRLLYYTLQYTCILVYINTWQISGGGGIPGCPPCTNPCLCNPKKLAELRRHHLQHAISNVFAGYMHKSIYT